MGDNRGPNPLVTIAVEREAQQFGDGIADTAEFMREGLVRAIEDLAED